MTTGTIRPAQVTVRESTLFDAWLVGLESGEFRQISERFNDGSAGRCVWGVQSTMMYRAQLSIEERHAFLRSVRDIERRAGELLGYAGGIAEANDSGESFTIIAAALRAARIAVERDGAL